MSKKRIFIIGSCVSRDLFELTDKYEIAEYVARTSLASAFHDKPFLVASNDLLEETIESNWQRKCVRYDTHKLLRSLLKEKQYDAILLDFVDERFNLLQYEDAFATLSGEFKLTGLHKIPLLKKIKTGNRYRRKLWIKAINNLVDIAIDKNIPVLLNQVYPAFRDASGKRHRFFKVCQSALYLHWLYQNAPKYIQKLRVPRQLLITDPQHKWGGSEQFHFIPAVYNCLFQQFEKAL